MQQTGAKCFENITEGVMGAKPTETVKSLYFYKNKQLISQIFLQKMSTFTIVTIMSSVKKLNKKFLNKLALDVRLQ